METTPEITTDPAVEAAAKAIAREFGYETAWVGEPVWPYDPDHWRRIATAAIDAYEAAREVGRWECDSCSAATALTFSPEHDAHFCAPCLRREVGLPTR